MNHTNGRKGNAPDRSVRIASPGSPDECYAAHGPTLDAELARYAAVLVFESAACGGISSEGGNRARSETLAEAAALDAKVKAVWSRHPRFHHIPQAGSFFGKMETG